MPAATLLDLNRLWVDSRPRALAQRRVELPALDALAGHPRGGRLLELGCGRRGTGVRQAITRLAATSVDAVDLDQDSVLACRAATADLGDRVRILHRDARELTVAERSYHLVLACHVLHHTPDWRTVLVEAARVLRPGGLLLSCEMTAAFIDAPALRAVSRHPDDGDRPTPGALAEAGGNAGLCVVGQRTRFRGAWTAMVAVRP